MIIHKSAKHEHYAPRKLGLYSTKHFIQCQRVHRLPMWHIEPQCYITANLFQGSLLLISDPLCSIVLIPPLKAGQDSLVTFFLRLTPDGSCSKHAPYIIIPAPRIQLDRRTPNSKTFTIMSIEEQVWDATAATLVHLHSFVAPWVVTTPNHCATKLLSIIWTTNDRSTVTYHSEQL